MRQVATILWKELKELKMLQGTRAGMTRLAVVLGIIGVWFPLQFGPGWVKSPASSLTCAWISLFMTATIIADTFAGERERHTLESLLAMPLSDVAILLGKTITGVLYGWVLGTITYLLAITALSLHAGGGLVLPPPLFVVGTLTLNLLAAWLAAGIGVLVSLKAATVRQAYQTLNVSFVLLMLVPTLLVPLVPLDVRRQVETTVTTLGGTTLAVTGMMVLAAADLLLMVLASRRFRRDRLILD